MRAIATSKQPSGLAPTPEGLPLRDSAGRSRRPTVNEDEHHGDLTDGARWYTAANFETVFPLTADLNIGSTYEPLYVSDACECAD